MNEVSTDGCSELTCPHHGAENRRKLAELARQERQNCRGFHWIGQSFRSCDNCGAPYWEHEYDLRIGDAGPFAKDPWKQVPITAEQAEACRRKWDPDYAGAQ